MSVVSRVRVESPTLSHESESSQPRKFESSTTLITTIKYVVIRTQKPTKSEEINVCLLCNAMSTADVPSIPLSVRHVPDVTTHLCSLVCARGRGPGTVPTASPSARSAQTDRRTPVAERDRRRSPAASWAAPSRPTPAADCPPLSHNTGCHWSTSVTQHRGYVTATGPPLSHNTGCHWSTSVTHTQHRMSYNTGYHWSTSVTQHRVSSVTQHEVSLSLVCTSVT